MPIADREYSQVPPTVTLGDSTQHKFKDIGVEPANIGDEKSMWSAFADLEPRAGHYCGFFLSGRSIGPSTERPTIEIAQICGRSLSTGVASLFSGLRGHPTDVGCSLA